MTRLMAVALIVWSMLTAAACHDRTPESSIAGVEPARAALRVSIVGPHLVMAPGAYEWSADVQGVTGEVTYEWTVQGITRPVSVSGTGGAVLALALDDYFDGALDLSVVVRSGDQAALATHSITLCPQRHAVDWCFPDSRLQR